jgi:predicted metal-binding protein
MLKVGIIRCRQTEDICCGDIDFTVARRGRLAFRKTGPVEVVGFASCGGCPGKNAVTRAKIMVQSGARAIAFASCVAKGTPNDFPCPFFAKMKKVMMKELGSKIKIIDWTHD